MVDLDVIELHAAIFYGIFDDNLGDEICLIQDIIQGMK